MERVVSRRQFIKGTSLADASGWVDYSTSPDLKGAVRAYSGEHGLMTVHNVQSGAVAGRFELA